MFGWTCDVSFCTMLRRFGAMFINTAQSWRERHAEHNDNQIHHPLPRLDCRGISIFRVLFLHTNTFQTYHNLIYSQILVTSPMGKGVSIPNLCSPARVPAEFNTNPTVSPCCTSVSTALRRCSRQGPGIVPWCTFSRDLSCLSGRGGNR